MKTFKDLQFEKHPAPPINGESGIQAVMDFPNGWGISAVMSPWTWGWPRVYELAARANGRHTDIGPFEGGVMTGCNQEDVTKWMEYLQNLPILNA